MGRLRHPLPAHYPMARAKPNCIARIYVLANAAHAKYSDRRPVERIEEQPCRIGTAPCKFPAHGCDHGGGAARVDVGCGETLDIMQHRLVHPAAAASPSGARLGQHSLVAKGRSAADQLLELAMRIEIAFTAHSR